uniref:DUF4806 domain-containing protein n=1 Tax=Anopheles epiroticus TaxID=199890 RepID=A0A182P5B5_9DIPT
MPYAVVETTDALGNKELLAAPECWIQRHKDGKQYLCWPNVRNISSLNALLLDERSVPSLMWEKHQCVVKRSRLLSLALASKAVDAIQNGSEKGTSSAAPVANAPSAVRGSTQARTSEPMRDAAQVFSASDPLETTSGTASQVPEMFTALKRLIDKNQEEMTTKMNEGFHRIQKTLVSLMHRQRTVEGDGGAAASQSPSATTSRIDGEFDMRPLTTVEEMNEFEERLKDSNFRAQVHSWIDRIVSYERNPEGRMMEILDLMFDRHLLPQFNWTGTNPKGFAKRAFSEYVNIIALFMYTGTTEMHRADKLFVTHFFMKKLRHAPNRAATLKGLRRCVPHSPRTTTLRLGGGKAAKSVSDGEERSKYFKISRIAYGNEEDSDGNSNSTQDGYKITLADLQDVVVEEHEDVDFSNIEIKSTSDMQPTLFMSAEDGMAYTLLETRDASGHKELLAAPESWIERDESGTRAFLYWPDVRNATMLNALLADPSSTPLPGWEKHPCVVKCANVRSLDMAGKMIKTLQKHWNDHSAAAKKITSSEAQIATNQIKVEPYDREELQTNCQENGGTDEPSEAQLVEMFAELTRKIESNHAEVKKKLYDEFRRVEKGLDTLMAKSLPCSGRNTVATHLNNRSVEFHVNQLTSVEQMNDFEERLEDEEYRTQMKHWIDCTVSCERHPDQRMQEILFALFDREFLTKLSWTGLGQTSKVGLIKYENIISLFQYAGLDNFEKQLSDPDILNGIHRWVNETVAYEVNPKRRMAEIMNLLFDRHFLAKFSWTGRKPGSYALIRYINVMRLFQYVGTTVSHHADHNYVADFFIKVLKNAGKRATIK